MLPGASAAHAAEPEHKTVRLNSQQLKAWYRVGQPLSARASDPAAMAYASDMFCRRAAAGSVDALAQLGWLQLFSASDASNIPIASSLFRRAAAHGHAKARELVQRFPADADQLPACLTEPRLAAYKNEVKRAGGTSAGQRHRSRVSAAVTKLAKRYKLDPRLVLSIIQLESGFRTQVVSPQNAMGLMQLTPDTAARFGVKDPKNWRQNLRGGMAYLRWLLAYFEGDVILVAAAYNAGEGNVNKYDGVPPFKETMDYVAKMRAIYHRDFHPFNPRVSSASPMLAKRVRPADQAALTTDRARYR